MKIYVAIAYHGEGEEVYSSLLSSINEQESVSFDNFLFIFSRSDGGNTFPDLTKYPNIKDNCTCISSSISPQGPGASRQQAIDYAQLLSDDPLDRVIMMDIDDSLTSTSSLKYLYETCCVNYSYVDMIVFPLECYSQELQSTVQSEVPPCNHVEPQSKCYKLDFLKKNNIHFPRNSWTYEDRYWQACLFAIPYFSCAQMDVSVYRYMIPDNSKPSTSNYINFEMPLWDKLVEWVNRYDEFDKWRENKRTNFCEFYNLQLSILSNIIELNSPLDPDVAKYYQVCLSRLTSDIINTKEDLGVEADICDQQLNYIKALEEYRVSHE